MEKSLISDVSWEDLKDMNQLKKNAVHIFKVRIDEHHHRYHLRYPEVLSREELSASTRFRHITDSRTYLVSRFIQRSILGYMTGKTPGNLSFHLSGNKKPALANCEFNISHSGNYMMFAFAPVPIGIDIELHKPDFDSSRLMDFCFDKEEQLYINSGSDPLFRFFQLWTRKEAILKASGEGLTDHLPELNCLKNEVSRMNGKYSIQSHSLDRQYLWSLVVQVQVPPDFFYWNYTI